MVGKELSSLNKKRALLLQKNADSYLNVNKKMNMVTTELNLEDN